MIGGMVQTDNYNPHVERIETEHSYAVSEVITGHAPLQKRCRVLSQWLQTSTDECAAAQSIRMKTPDGTVLNDGLLFLEVQDAIHEGDGPRLLHCWKLMMLYWRHGGHTKYALA